MTVHNQQFEYTVQAAADLSAQASRFRAINFAGTLLIANPVAGTSDRAAGILINAPRSGEWASYVYRGITKVIAGAAINTLGYPLMVGSSGFIFAAASGFAHIGRALETCASGDLVQANVDFTALPLWSGV